MNLSEKLKALKKWQTCGWTHPLTCMKHHMMDVIAIGSEVVLLCPECGTLQTYTPEECFHPPEVSPDPFDHLPFAQEDTEGGILNE